MPPQGGAAVAEIQVEPRGKDTFVVQVSEPDGRSRHRVTLDAGERARYGGDAAPEALLVESFRFLLEREPRGSILASFRLSAIERYFPDYPAEIRRRLAGAE
jgi:hypothetical protein